MSLINHFKVITVTHHNLNIQEISNFYINKTYHNKEEALSTIKSEFNIEECLYLETCNRVSYILYSTTEINEQFLQSFFQRINPALQKDTLNSVKKYVTTYEGSEAIRHIFELASSIDSLVVGEREIFTQFRSAYSEARELGNIGDKLRLLEISTVTTAKKIYSETKIGEKALSVVSLAIRKMMEKNPKADNKILLVGSGETNRLVGKFLKKYAFTNIHIYNRSLNNAQDLSETLGASSYHIKELSEVRAFDTIIVCTSANKVVIDLALYQKMLNGDSSNKTLIDLSVPRNISEEVVAHCDTDYIDIQSLKEIAEKNLQFRKAEIKKAKPIIDHQISEFRQRLQDRQIEIALTKLPAEMSAIKDRAINEVYKNRIESLDPKAQELILEMMEYMEKKSIAAPMRLSKELT